MIDFDVKELMNLFSNDVKNAVEINKQCQLNRTLNKMISQYGVK